MGTHGSVRAPGMAVAEGVTPATRTGMRVERRREMRAAYLFIFPTFLLFALFVAGPLLASIGISFTHYDVFTTPRWAGLSNYQQLAVDQQAIASFRNTAVFVVFSVAIELVLALFLALGIQRKMPTPLRYFFRTAYFLPIITSSAAMGIVFGFMFNKDFGVINYYLGQLGIDRIPWVTSTRYSLWTIILGAAWQRLGFTFILFSAGLQNIPRELYEAADLDGATGWSRLTRITLPLLSPTILFTAVIGIIGSLQIFDLPKIITNGGPGDSSRTVVMIIQEAGFGNLQFGYGSAIAVVLFLLIMLLTLVQFWISRKWVYYR